MEFLVYLPFLVFLTIIIYLYKRDGTIFSFSGFIIFIYLISFASSIILDSLFYKQKYEISSSLYFIFVNLLFILPLIKIRGRKKIQIIGNNKLIFQIAKIYAYLGIIAILYYFPSVLKALEGNLRDNRILSGSEAFVSTQGIITMLMSLIANSYMLNLFFYFYAVYQKWPNRITTLLLISSFSFVANSLAWVGRDGIVLWSLSFFSMFLLFRWNLDKKTKKKMLRTIFIISIPALILFFTITFSRFSNIAKYNFNPFISIIDYTGQQYRNFTVQFNSKELKPENNILNGTNKILSKFGIENQKKRNKKANDEMFMQIHYNTSLYVFSTYLGTFRMNFGNINTAIIAIIWCLLIFRIKKLERFSMLFIYVFFYQIILQGIFYYRLGIGYGDFVIYETIILFFIFNNNKSFVLK